MSALEDYRAADKSDTRTFLDMLNQILSFQSKDSNLEVGYLNKETGEASKWKSWWEVRDSPFWLGKINNRLIAIPEVVLDFDPAEDEDLERFEQRVIASCRDLKRDGYAILGTYTTGSRGYHVHILLPGLEYRPRHRAEAIKRYIIRKFEGDTAKASLRCMIAIEGVPHWKTGRPKEEIDMSEKVNICERQTT